MKDGKDSQVKFVEGGQCSSGECGQGSSVGIGQDIDMFEMYKIDVSHSPPVQVELLLNDFKVLKEIDTEASCSVMNLQKFKELGDEKDLKETSVRLRTYTGEVVKPCGVADVRVVYEGCENSLPLIVVEGGMPTLLGRNWLQNVKLDWKAIFPLTSEDYPLKLDEMLDRYESVFRDELGCLKDFKVKLPVDESAKPRFCKARRVPYALREGIEKELQGILKKVEYSRWAAPVVAVPKDEAGAVRLCGDYKQTINQVAPVDTYPVPSTEDLFATLKGGEKFSKLDLSQAYQQLQLEEQTQELLTINTHCGLYQPTHLQFGVHSATGIFQREMDKRLKSIPHCIVRIDDILVSGEDDQGHLKNLERVLSVLDEAGLKLKKAKCRFLLPEVTYLGFRISKDGVAPLPEKVAAMQDAPSPTTVTELKAYLGALNYYNHHLPNLSSVIKPLHRLLKKGLVWLWGSEQENAFKDTKKMLCSAPLLTHFDPTKPIVIHVDASPYGVGAVMAHKMENGDEKPVCYISRTLSAAEKNYAHIEKEGLALVFAVKKLHQYLYGHCFKLYTDHKPLLGLFGENKPIPPLAAARVQRWAIFLSAYRYELDYRAGSANSNADCLSRLPINALLGDYSVAGNVVNMMDLIQAPVTVAEVRVETRKDPVMSRVYELTMEGWGNHTAVAELKPYFNKRDELSCEDGVVLWGNRVVIPSKLRSKVLEELHQTHVGIVRMLALARGFIWWPNLDEDVELTCKECRTCVQAQSSPKKAPMHVWEYPSRPWERVHVDFAGPFLGHMFLIVVDAYSK